MISKYILKSIKEICSELMLVSCLPQVFHDSLRHRNEYYYWNHSLPEYSIILCFSKKWLKKTFVIFLTSLYHKNQPLKEVKFSKFILQSPMPTVLVKE